MNAFPPPPGQPGPPQPPFPQQTSLRDMLVGVWDCYGGGISTELVLQSDRTYSATCIAAGTAHWGEWDVTPGPGSMFLRFTLKGHQPNSFVGPLGSTPIHWPDTETWVILGVEPNQVTVQGGMMIRRQMQPGWGPFAGALPPGAPAPAPPGGTPTAPAVADAIKSWTEANQKIQDTFRQANQKTREMYQKLNDKWSEYFRR
jgi:hypothetical protein